MKLTIEVPDDRDLDPRIDWNYIRRVRNNEVSLNAASKSVRRVLEAALAAYDAQRPIEVGEVVTSGGRQWHVLAIGSTAESERALLLSAVDNGRLEGMMERAVKRVAP